MQASSLSSYNCYDSKQAVRQTLNIQVTAHVFETHRGWQKLKEKSNKSFQESNRKSFHRKQHEVNYKLKNPKRKGKTECPRFVGDSRRDKVFPLQKGGQTTIPFCSNVLVKLFTTPKIPSKECFPSTISSVQKRRLQPEVTLENCNWWSTLQNILPCPAPPKHCSRPLHHAGCERSHFNPEVTTCVIMCYQVTYYISCRLLILVSFTKRQLWKQLNLNY